MGSEESRTQLDPSKPDAYIHGMMCGPGSFTVVQNNPLALSSVECGGHPAGGKLDLWAVQQTAGPCC